MKKRLFSLMMSLLLVVSMLPVSSIAIYAEDTEVDSQIETIMYQEESDDPDVLANDESFETTIELYDLSSPTCLNHN